ncbi:serine/threonine-protein kinase Wnk-like isoform X2 [Sycon ciliatum]|uniref:serine/threonine-protein kinase Wnk-like isoform X2 n=1 Tax=Sycon ciliatum TaxID=27933 RepID=UPI0031F62706
MKEKISEDILNDLCSRFLINLPKDVKDDTTQLFFYIEMAYWYYLDLYVEEDSATLPRLDTKKFAMRIFRYLPYLTPKLPEIDQIYERWKEFKKRVPCHGAILMNHDLTKCVLVESYYNGNWMFPRGKANKDESALYCAIREVEEETGYNFAPLARENDFLEQRDSTNRLVRLYLVPGVSTSEHFAPKTRNEVKGIQWFDIDSLPTGKNDHAAFKKSKMSPRNFFMVFGYVRNLRKWIAAHRGEILRQQARSRSRHPLGAGPAASGVLTTQQQQQPQQVSGAGTMDGASASLPPSMMDSSSLERSLLAQQPVAQPTAGARPSSAVAAGDSAHSSAAAGVMAPVPAPGVVFGGLMTTASDVTTATPTSAAMTHVSLLERSTMASMPAAAVPLASTLPPGIRMASAGQSTASPRLPLLTPSSMSTDTTPSLAPYQVSAGQLSHAHLGTTATSAVHAASPVHTAISSSAVSSSQPLLPSQLVAQHPAPVVAAGLTVQQQQQLGAPQHQAGQQMPPLLASQQHVYHQTQQLIPPQPMTQQQQVPLIPANQQRGISPSMPPLETIQMPKQGQATEDHRIPHSQQSAMSQRVQYQQPGPWQPHQAQQLPPGLVALPPQQQQQQQQQQQSMTRAPPQQAPSPARAPRPSSRNTSSTPSSVPSQASPPASPLRTGGERMRITDLTQWILKTAQGNSGTPLTLPPVELKRSNQLYNFTFNRRDIMAAYDKPVKQPRHRSSSQSAHPDEQYYRALEQQHQQQQHQRQQQQHRPQPAQHQTNTPRRTASRQGAGSGGGQTRRSTPHRA